MRAAFVMAVVKIAPRKINGGRESCSAKMVFLGTEFQATATSSVRNDSPAALLLLLVPGHHPIFTQTVPDNWLLAYKKCLRPENAVQAFGKAVEAHVEESE